MKFEPRDLWVGAYWNRSPWGGPTIPTVAGINLDACPLCRRRLKHTWPEHTAQIRATSDPLAQAAGLPQGDAA